MIEISNISKTYPIRNGYHKVLENVNLQINPGDKLGVLGTNGSGKSTLIRILSGVEKPDTGKIVSSLRISWPLALSGGFQGSLTGLDNMKFICRVYGVNHKEKEKELLEFTELGKLLREEVKKYSAGMRARLAFGISLLIDFDCYLIDEITSVGDAEFQEKCKFELFNKRCDKTFIIISHEEELLRKECNKFIVLQDANIKEFSNAIDAYSFYNQKP